MLPKEQMPCEEGLTVEEGLQLAQQLNKPVKGDGVVSRTKCDLPSQQDQPRKEGSAKV